MRESRGSNHALLMREVNDRVFQLLSELRIEDGEFLCECSDEGCIERIPLTQREYAALQKAEDRTPLKLPSHPD